MKARFDGSHYILQQPGARERIAITPQEACDLIVSLGLEMAEQGDLKKAIPGPSTFERLSTTSWESVRIALENAKRRLDP